MVGEAGTNTSENFTGGPLLARADGRSVGTELGILLNSNSA